MKISGKTDCKPYKLKHRIRYLYIFLIFLIMLILHRLIMGIYLIIIHSFPQYN